ncbi:iron complex transport system ATP-binding protein [Neisseria sp. HSC-16F19]|nr:ATP-binding cassette domain-containing protein [Neisseria sp. HSC-16F19]MCP2040239.1 iron complex transport system ATP-binding protein [Neisseria sp. HSC-16F19]
MISIENVSHHIGSQRILNRLSLDIPAGGITALVGPNGAGKSTLLSLMARLQPLSDGHIRYGSQDTRSTASSELARTVAILTQENNIHSRITVRDLLMFGRYPHHQGRPQAEDSRVVAQALQDFQLQAFAERYLTELSGGQRQRALIAMVFCQQTPYVLLDEPLNNLDMFHARELMRQLRRLTDQNGLTTVMVVHDINMAAAWADRIVILQDGELACQGSPNDLINPDILQRHFGLDADVLDYQGKKLVVHHV